MYKSIIPQECVFVCVWVQVPMHVEARGQLCRLSSLLSPVSGFWGINSGPSVCILSAFTWWHIDQPHPFFIHFVLICLYTQDSLLIIDFCLLLLFYSLQTCYDYDIWLQLPTSFFGINELTCKNVMHFLSYSLTLFLYFYFLLNLFLETLHSLMCELFFSKTLLPS